MAKRSPLGYGSSFGTPAFNPGDVQFHSYWGQYIYDASGTPNNIQGRVGSVGSKSLPNEQNNLLNAPEFDKLRTGDIASTAFDSGIASGAAPSNLAQAQAQGLYVCVYPGTVGTGNAVWERLDEAVPVEQVVRDAHVIVVGVDGALATLAGLASPPLPANGLNLSGIGDIVSITCDYLDAGDGAQLEQALTAAAGAGIGIDIRIRPGLIKITGAAAVPLVLPQDCRLLGAGMWETTIESRNAADDNQQILSMAKSSEIKDLYLWSQAGSGTIPGGPAVVRTTGSATRVTDCRFGLEGAARTQTIAFWDSSGSAEVKDCRFSVAAQTDYKSTVLRPGTGIFFGTGGNYTDGTAKVINCDFSGGNRAVFFYNYWAYGGGGVDSCQANGISTPTARLGGIFGWMSDFTGPASGLLPTFHNCFATCISAEDAADTDGYAGFVYMNRAPNTVGGLMGDFSNCRVIFTTDQNYAVMRRGFFVECNVAAAQMVAGTIVNCMSLGHTVGIELSIDGVLVGTAPEINDWRVNSCVVASPSDTTPASTPASIWLHRTGNGVGSMQSNGIANCSGRTHPLGGYGLFIDSSAISNTIALGNQLQGTGTAISDAGTNTEASHNIIA